VMKGVSAELTEAMENGPELAWPYFLVLDPEGKRIGGFGGDHDANTLARAFEHAAGSLPSKTRSDSLPWDTMHRRHDALAAAEGEKDAEKRFATLRRLAAENAAGPVGRRASALLAAARAAAQRVLFEAREVAAREGAAKAAEAIDAALAAADSGAAPAFEPAARDDLVRVRDRLREKGSFPTLEVSK
jgi:hypothetical protein